MLKLPLPPNIEAVVFDLDGTLYKQWPVRLHMAAQLTAWAVLHPFSGPTVPRLLRRFRRAQEVLRESDAPEASTDQSLGDQQLAWATSGVEADLEASRKIVCEWMFERPLRAVRIHTRRELLPVLRELRERGVKLAVYSDYPADAKLQAMGIHSQFDAVVSSYDVDVSHFKPHPAGLLKTLDLLGVKPAGAVYVGDRPETDAVGARAAGMHVIIICRATRGLPKDGFTSIRTLRELVE